MVFHEGTQTEILLLTGKIVVEASAIDLVLSSVLGQKLGYSAEQIDRELIPKDTRWKAERLEEASDSQPLRDVAKSIKSFLQDRNLIVHGFHTWPQSETFTEGYRDRAELVRGRGDRSHAQRLSEVYKSVLETAEKIASELLAFLPDRVNIEAS